MAINYKTIANLTQIEAWIARNYTVTNPVERMAEKSGLQPVLLHGASAQRPVISHWSMSRNYVGSQPGNF